MFPVLCENDVATNLNDNEKLTLSMYTIGRRFLKKQSFFKDMFSILYSKNMMKDIYVHMYVQTKIKAKVNG